jgi:hypothetical protein
MQFKTLTPPVLATGAPVRLTATDKWVRSAIIQSKLANAANAYVGDSSANAVVDKGFELEPGDPLPLQGDAQSSQNAIFNLKEIWIGGTTGDDVTVQYMEDISG